MKKNLMKISGICATLLLILIAILPTTTMAKKSELFYDDWREAVSAVQKWYLDQENGLIKINSINIKAIDNGYILTVDYEEIVPDDEDEPDTSDEPEEHLEFGHNIIQN